MAIELEQFQLILLRRPADPATYDEAESDWIQREHVTFYQAQREVGHVVTNGPVIDQPDEALRGIVIFAVGSVDRASELAGADPAVRAGRLEVEAMTWWCPPQTMVRSGQPVTIED
jgi:uncharacterized protein YciI